MFKRKPRRMWESTFVVFLEVYAALASHPGFQLGAGTDETAEDRRMDLYTANRKCVRV